MDRFQNLQKLRLPARPPDARAHLERVLEALVNDYGAERIIAFGSCVHGKATEHSDVDLCVIREHPPDRTHPHLEALTAIGSARTLISTDVLVRTPRQWEQARHHPFGVMDEVIHHGVALFER